MGDRQLAPGPGGRLYPFASFVAMYRDEAGPRWDDALTFEAPAPDGTFYTWPEFQAHYGERAKRMWQSFYSRSQRHVFHWAPGTGHMCWRGGAPPIQSSVSVC